MIMLYITIIIVVLLICFTIGFCIYIKTLYNPSTYTESNTKYATYISQKLLDKCVMQDSSEESDKYKYIVTNEEMIDFLDTIIKLLNPDNNDCN